MAYSVVISALRSGKLAATVQCEQCGYTCVVPDGPRSIAAIAAVKMAHSIRHDKKAASPVAVKAAVSRAG